MIYTRRDYILYTYICINSYNSKQVGRGPEKTFFKKRGTDGQLTYGKMLNITNYTEIKLTCSLHWNVEVLTTGLLGSHNFQVFVFCFFNKIVSQEF